MPSNLYSCSFAPNPAWTPSFSPQAEIQAYLRDCAARFGVVPHVRLRHEVTRAAWDEAARCWRVDTTQGRFVATVLVSARGPLSEPRLPDVPGLEEFSGALFHSARWDHGHDLRGERVAVIGTGASAIQFVPEIQPLVRQVTIFQRTAPWVIPRRDRRLTSAEHLLFRAFPPAQLAARAAIYWGREAFVLGFVGDPARRAKRAEVATIAARRLLGRQIRDPELRDKLTPNYELGCKRILLSNDYYPALGKENVELVTEPISRVTEHGIVTADGQERPAETILLGTGFDVTAHAAATCTVGRDGRSLAETWAQRVAAYKGMTVHGFPNLFLMVGPNSGLGHSSIVFMIESQITYVLGALDAMARRNLACIEVTHGAQEAWTAAIDRRSASTVWTGGGCRSYYLDAVGRNVTLWPGPSWTYRRHVRRFDLDAYVVEPSEKGRVPLRRPVPEPFPPSPPGSHEQPRTWPERFLRFAGGRHRRRKRHRLRHRRRAVCVDIDGSAAAATAKETGGEARTVDVADRAEMADFAHELCWERGAPDVLVNNAGVGLTGRFLDTTPEDWDWILGINVNGVVHGSQVFGPAMLARGRGHVVNVSSGLAFAPRATEPAYVTTKAAVLALTRCLRADWGQHGVGVSAVCPGVIATAIVESARFRGERASAESLARVRRLFARGHRPELVAGAVVDSIRSDRPVVPVGAEAWAGWLLRGVVPSRVADRLACATLAGV